MTDSHQRSQDRPVLRLAWLGLAAAAALLGGPSLAWGQAASPQAPAAPSCRPLDAAGRPLPYDLSNGGFVCELYNFWRADCRKASRGLVIPHCFGTRASATGAASRTGRPSR